MGVRQKPGLSVGFLRFNARPNDTHSDINAVNRVESGGHPILLVGFGQPFPGCGRGFYQQTINRHQFDRYTMTPFDRALGVVLGHEGGDSDHAADPGGFTRFGISQVAHPTVDVRNLTREGAAEIYKQEYWGRLHCAELPAPVALMLFDSGVNQGCKPAVRFLQKATGAVVDGDMGPRTIAAVYKHPVSRIIRKFSEERIAHYLALGSFRTFGRGWLNRALDVAITATEWDCEDE